MKLKIRKKVAVLALLNLCLAVITTIGVKSIPVNAITMTIRDAGIKEYNGIKNDQAFAWTASDQVGFVSAEIQIAGNPNYFRGYNSSNTGWVQTAQITYPSSKVGGLHWAGTSKDICDSKLTLP